MCVSLELYVCRAQGWQLETGSVGRVVKVRLKAGPTARLEVVDVEMDVAGIPGLQIPVRVGRKSWI